MTVELVTGHAGNAHVTGADWGAFNAGTVGADAYVLADSLPALAMADANTLVVPACELLVQGRHVRITAAESVTIESGSQSAYRKDLVMARYELDASTAVESVELVAVTGAPSSSSSGAADPTTDWSALSILDGATKVDVPLVRVSLDGLTPEAEWAVGCLAPLSDLAGDVEGIVEDVETLSVCVGGCHIYAGTIVVNLGTSSKTEFNVFNESTFMSRFNTTDPMQCAVCYGNGAAGASGGSTLGAITAELWDGGSYDGWHARWTTGATGNKRFNYIVIVPDAYSTV